MLDRLLEGEGRYGLVRILKSGPLGALLALAVMLAPALLLPMESARAEQRNSIRIGGTYEFITLRRGEGFQACRRHCNKDAGCKAWTFIKQRVRTKEGLSLNLGPDLSINLGGNKREVIPPQCRLKHTVGARRANDCCISGVKKVVRRSPGKAEHCATYAERSIEQYDRNLSSRCRYRGEKWHGNYRRHYRWCMDVPQRRSSRRLDDRTDDLRSCRRDSRKRDRRCDRYASHAMDLFDQAKANDCLKDLSLRWDREYDRVYNWCRDRRPAKRQQAMKKARANLAACLRRGGGPRIERCETYADNALAKVAKARKNRCGFGGRTWSPGYKVHYQDCRKSSRSSLRVRNQRRTDNLARCLRQSERGGGDVHADNCRQYGRKAVRQYNKSQRLACGVAGRFWHDNESRHRRFCSRRGLGVANRVLNNHADILRRCRNDQALVDRPSDRGEVSLGCVTVKGKDRDTITVGRARGRFRSLVLTYGKVSVRTMDATVEFGNGRTQKLDVGADWRKKTTTRPIDLNGNRRFINNIRLYQKAKFKLGGKARVCVTGIR